MISVEIPVVELEVAENSTRIREVLGVKKRATRYGLELH